MVVLPAPTHSLHNTGVRLPWCSMELTVDTSQRRPRSLASPAPPHSGRPRSLASPAPPHSGRPRPLASPALLHTGRPRPLASPAPPHFGRPHLASPAQPNTVLLLFLLLSALLVPAAGGENGELCVVETPLRTRYVRPVVETSALCHGCLFPTPTPTPDAHTPPIQQVHIVHVEEPEGGAVQVVVTGHERVEASRVAIVLHSTTASPPVTFTVTAAPNTLSNSTTKHLLLVSGEDQVRGRDLRYSVAHQHTLSEDDLIPSTHTRFGFVTSYTRVPLANTIILHLPKDDESDEGCGTEVQDDSPVANCFVSVEQPISGCYHHNMLGESHRDIHIIEVDGSSNSNGSLVLAVVGNGEGDGRGFTIGGGKGVERNITLVLRTSRPTTWSLRATSLQGTITLLVGGGDQVENTSVSGPGVMVEVRRFDVPATFDQLILTVLTRVGPPVSYTRTTTPNKITITVLQKMENRVVPDNKRPTVYAEDVAGVIQAGLSVSCDENTMTVAIPFYISERVGGISMSLGDRSCPGVMNASHIVVKEIFGRCKFMTQSSSYQTTYTNYVNVELGPTISDDEDFDGSGYGSEDEYYPARIPPIQVQCQVQKLLTYPQMPSPAIQPTYKKTTNESLAGATYKMDMFRDSDYKIPIRSDDFPVSTNINRRLYIRTALASVMPLTEAYDVHLRVVLEQCWLSNSSIPHRPGAPHESLVRKSCPLRPSVIMEPVLFHSFSFQVLPEYNYLGSFYLHCQLGVCSADSLPRPAVNRCIDPEHYCGKSMLMRVFDDQPSSSSLQTLTLGPFSMDPRKKSPLSQSVVSTAMESAGSSAGTSATDDKTQIIVLGGLSTEIVVGIALASFVIGVCLTATLWVIHMKTDPHRQKRPEGGAPRNSGYDLSAHSGSSTPSSQAPMTA
ncbi:LOW QUALITY PROTEIN: transforming growth factor beta receptor type 3 [Procambarus clarkii]|uniref:LOW QUALITY PROTEIN: transforming growth factor beta receptor type 3 n=1 Tax=Procambarus clarkii TaxID=6728 RepID=UPI003741FD8D